MRGLDYTNLSDVLNEISDVLVVDLLDHSLQFDSKYNNTLVDPEKGVYLSGSLKPIITFNEKTKYYPKSSYLNDKELLINYDCVMSCKEDIVNSECEVILSIKDKINKKKFLHPEPNIPVTAIKVALAVADDYISSICEFSKNQLVGLDLNKLIKDEYQHLIDQEVYSKIYKKLINEIALFVKNDIWNIYFYKLKGCTLVIEKSVDWRIYRYYQIMLEEKEEN